jgi:hypothetical protein
MVFFLLTLLNNINTNQLRVTTFLVDESSKDESVLDIQDKNKVFWNQFLFFDKQCIWA